MSATFKLPPSERDFEVFFDLLESLSTRASAERHKISQTRVRQLRVLVADWLADVLPETTEVDLKKQVRLAQHIAAGRLEHQYEQAMRFWDTDRDPKHLRQATRIALAQARLGVVPGRLHALAADALKGPAELGDCRTEQCENLVPDLPPGNALPRGSSLACAADMDSRQDPRESGFPGGSLGTSSGGGSLGTSSLGRPEAHPTKEDCSPKAAAASGRPTEQEIHSDAVTLEGVRLIESRLLTLIADQEGTHPQKVADLNETLTRIRREKAQLELRLAPYIVGAEVERADGVSPPLAANSLAGASG